MSDDRRFMADGEAMRKLKDSKPINEVNTSDYDVIFMAGGWGATYHLGLQSPVAGQEKTSRISGKREVLE